MSVLYEHIQTVWPMPDISSGTMGGSSMRSAIGPEKTGYSAGTAVISDILPWAAIMLLSMLLILSVRQTLLPP